MYAAHYTKQSRTAEITLDGSGETITATIWAIAQTTDGQGISWIADYTTARGARRILEVSAEWAADNTPESFYSNTVCVPSFRPKRLAGASRVRYTAETIIDDLLSGNLNGWAVSHKAI